MKKAEGRRQRAESRSHITSLVRTVLNPQSSILNPAPRPAEGLLRIAVIAILLIGIATLASACPVCYGNAQTPLTKGASNGILFLLGIVGSVQVGFVALFISFWKRAKALQRVGAGSQPAQLKLINKTSEIDAK